MAVIIDKERVEYLAHQLTNMYAIGVPKNLGNIALEIILTRNASEQILEGDYPEDEKKRARETLNRLRELEKTLIHLYMAHGMESKKKARNLLNEYVLRGYKYGET